MVLSYFGGYWSLKRINRLFWDLLVEQSGFVYSRFVTESDSRYGTGIDLMAFLFDANQIAQLIILDVFCSPQLTEAALLIPLLYIGLFIVYI